MLRSTEGERYWNGSETIEVEDDFLRSLNVSSGHVEDASGKLLALDKWN
jgi:hypothetical protein